MLRFYLKKRKHSTFYETINYEKNDHKKDRATRGACASGL